jgi:RNA polymerase sigma-70 factor (ECF subfamily)
MESTETGNWQELRAKIDAAVRRGDDAVLQDFYNEHFDFVYRYVLCRVEYNHTDAEEIVEEIFVQVFRDIGRYDGVQPPCRWMLGIARNRIIDHYRRKGRKPVVELLFSQFDEQFARRLFNLEAQEIPDAELERSELAVVVELILSQLPPDYERVLRLRYLEEKPVKDLAAALKTTPKAAEALLYRARNTFRDAFRIAEKNLSF